MSRTSPEILRSRYLIQAKFGHKTAVAGTMALILMAASVGLANAAPTSFADLVEEVSPAVVNIATVSERSSGPGVRSGSHERGDDSSPGLLEGHPFKDFFEKFFTPRDFGNAPVQPQRPQQRVTGAGSGFIIDAEGYVVTNSHVVDDAASIKITLRDGRNFDAALIGQDPKTDLALLKIDAKTPLPFVAFGDSDRARVGDWVLTVGNPFGLGGSVTAGIVSARGRDLPGGTLIDFLQIDAPINPGNSGGPAFNSKSEVIGVNTAIFSPNGGNVGIGFAIPSNLASAVIADLRDDGEVNRGWLGVSIQGVTEDIAKGFGLERPGGALVAAVQDDSPAAAAGLRSGDVILQWGNSVIENVNDLPRAVAFTPAGETLDIEIWRNRGPETLSVTTAAQPNRDRLASAQEPANDSLPSNLAGSLERDFDEMGITVSNLAWEPRADRESFVALRLDSA